MIHGEATANCGSGRADRHPGRTTLMARGAFPDTHPQNSACPGMHGTVSAV